MCALLFQAACPINRGGYRHIQHVRSNRGPHKKGAPQARDCRKPARHFLTCGVGPIYAVLRHLKHVSTECFCTLMSENLCESGAPTFLPNRARSGLNPALPIKRIDRRTSRQMDRQTKATTSTNYKLANYNAKFLHTT